MLSSSAYTRNVSETSQGNIAFLLWMQIRMFQIKDLKTILSLVSNFRRMLEMYAPNIQGVFFRHILAHILKLLWKNSCSILQTFRKYSKIITIIITITETKK